jgi:hypothetical protein
MAVVLSWFLEMPTLTSFLISYAPVAFIFFIILHEKTLQRNLISLKNNPLIETGGVDWIDILLSSMLYAVHNNKNCTVIIENKDILDYFLRTKLPINAYITKDILNIFILSNSYEDDKMIWIASDGYIRGINTVWKDEISQLLSMNNNDKSSVSYTLHNDAFICSIHPKMRTFTVVSNGIEVSCVEIGLIKNIIKKHIGCVSQKKEKRRIHENDVFEKSIF